MGSILGSKEEKKEAEKEKNNIEPSPQEEEKNENEQEEPENTNEQENHQPEEIQSNNVQVPTEEKDESAKKNNEEDNNYIYLSKRNKSEHETYIFKSHGIEQSESNWKRQIRSQSEENEKEGIIEEIQDEYKEPRNTELEESKSVEPKDAPKKPICYADINVEKKVNEKKNIGLIDIPRHEYSKFQGKEVIMIGNGMDTGEYKFIGEQTYIKEESNEVEQVPLTEEEITNEMKMRYNKVNEKKVKYEIVDKFFVVTEFGGKKIQKVDKNKNKCFYSCLGKYTEFMDGNNSNVNAQVINNSSRTWHQINYNNQMKLPLPSDNYSLYMLNQINLIRRNPQSFIEVIEEAKKKITIDRKGRIIYNGKVKIALSKGEAAFDEVIQILKNTKPMAPLEYNYNITVDAPRSIVESKDINDLSKKVEYMISNGGKVVSYWRDVVNDPEISFLLMIVDDNGYKSGMRRKDLLNPKMKYIGISSSELGNDFACYITLSL